jgi:hypothetical protein
MCRTAVIPCVKVGKDWRIDPEKAILSLSHTPPDATDRN